MPMLVFLLPGIYLDKKYKLHKLKIKQTFFITSLTHKKELIYVDVEMFGMMMHACM